MKIEKNIKLMMEMNLLLRIWHWETDNAHHHGVFEKFLGENELVTDSLMESALGNEFKVNLSEVRKDFSLSNKSLEESNEYILEYRKSLKSLKSDLEKSEANGADELVTILDTAIENTSKNLYLLKLK